MPRNISNPLRRGAPKPKVGEVGKIIEQTDVFSMNEFVEVLGKSGLTYTVQSLITGEIGTVKGDLLSATN
jgi:predicted nucleotide-binding protein (sugar kinase/HSP70/actin superfamily)